MVEVDEFETADQAVRGEMTLTITLSDAQGGGNNLVAVHDVLPPGVSAADNEAGRKSALARLAALVEADQQSATDGSTNRTHTRLMNLCWQEVGGAD